MARFASAASHSLVVITHVHASAAKLWRQYEDISSPEAALVKDFDKLEMIIQVAWCLAALIGNLITPRCRHT
jgi:5'-deoxynucleotidase YfbR-like HD superfamily hydrolase